VLLILLIYVLCCLEVLTSRVDLEYTAERLILAHQLQATTPIARRTQNRSYYRSRLTLLAQHSDTSGVKQNYVV